MSIDPKSLSSEEYEQLRARVHKEIRQREFIAKQEGIKSIIMDFRMLLAKLKVCPIPKSSFNSYDYMNKYSPIFKNKVQ